MSKCIVLLPAVLFSSTPLLMLYIKNINEVRIDALLLPISLIVIFVILLFLIFQKVYKKTIIAVAHLNLFAIAFFYYGYLTRFIQQYPAFTGLLHSRPEKVSIILIVFFLLCASILVLRLNKNSLQRLSMPLLIGSIVLVINPLFLIINKEIQRQPLKTAKDLASENKQNISNTPDIYYIIIERYAGFETLSKRYNFQSSLKDYLTKNNFYITNSYVNYPHTSLSLASSLNLNYLKDFEEKSDLLKGDQTHLFESINRSYLTCILKKKGYMIVNFGDQWQGTENNKEAKYNFNYYGPLPAFTRLFLKETIADFFYEKYRYEKDHVRSYKLDKKLSEDFKINKLKSVVKNNTKKFVFAHLLVTHEPYILNAKGKPISDLEFIKTPHEKKYISHINYGNTVLKKIVEIIKSNKRPYVMVIQADEGPYTEKLRQAVDDGNFSWSKVDQTDIKTHMSILNAYYLPDHKYGSLYKSISPVNTFRVILNQYFGHNLSLLPDKHYLNQDFNNLYQFSELKMKLD